MYNLIGNTCIASWITNKLLTQPFINPVCWSILEFQSAYNLVKHFYDINWNNFKLEWNDEKNECSIFVDDLVKIIYVHYKFAYDAEEITHTLNDIYSNKIWEYVYEKYRTRAKRMVDSKIEPRFIFTTPFGCEHSRANLTIDEQYAIAELTTKYPIIMSFPQNITHKNIISIKQDKIYNGNTIDMAKFIYSKIPSSYWTMN